MQGSLNKLYKVFYAYVIKPRTLCTAYSDNISIMYAQLYIYYSQHVKLTE